MDNSKKMKELLAGIGSMAELAHVTYTAMIQAGASKEEAMNGMNAFIDGAGRGGARICISA